jgi:uncharacterized GH25 family protein
VTINPACDGCRRAQIAQAIHDGIAAYFAGSGPGSEMHVEGIEMSLKQRGVWTSAVAAVQVVDVGGEPVGGATVTGEWTGSATSIGTLTTDENGVAAVVSDRTRDTSGTFTFTVTDVTRYGWTYAPDTNTETADSIDF